MSYASIAKHNIEGNDHGAVPDPNLLEGRVAAEEPHGNVNVVDPAEAERIRQGLQHAAEQPEHTNNSVAVPEVIGGAEPPAAHDQAEQAADQAQAAARDTSKQAQAKVNKAGNAAGELAKDAQEDVRDFAGRAEKQGKKLYAEGKEVAHDAAEKGREYLDKAEKKGDELAKDAKKEAKKLQRKASELDKDARAAARKYPVATAGLIGGVNLAVVAAVGYVAYANKDLPRWDRRAVTATIAGLGAWFGSQAVLGWHEYEENKRETGKGF